MAKPFVTGVEQFFDEDEIIVSKTDLKGLITYANKAFTRVAQYSECELLGKNHNIIRHPKMPRCVFKFLWDTIATGDEVFAYVINRCKNGDHYWVFAHVTASYDSDRNIISYHSTRRVPKRSAIETIEPIYAALLAEENKHPNPKEQWQASLPILLATLDEIGKTYEEFIFDICC